MTEKSYCIIRFDLTTNKIEVYSYQHSRELTTRQVWKFLRENEPCAVLPHDPKITVMDAGNIAQSLGFEPKRTKWMMKIPVV